MSTPRCTCSLVADLEPAARSLIDCGLTSMMGRPSSSGAMAPQAIAIFSAEAALRGQDMASTTTACGFVSSMVSRSWLYIFCALRTLSMVEETFSEVSFFSVSMTKQEFSSTPLSSPM